MSAWQELQEAALADVHPGWLAWNERELVMHARRTPLGRRLLARRLHGTAARRLLATPHDADADAALAERRWLLGRLGADEGTGLPVAVGGLHALPWIRRQLRRDRAVALQHVLGPAVYRRLLGLHADWQLGDDDTRALDAALGRAVEGDTHEPCRGALAALGCTELLAHGGGLHPGIAERLSLALGPRAAQRGEPRVPPAMLDRFLDELLEPTGGAA